ncbi:hypothetical protein [Nocardia higoensis]|uniref:hypothetical protein n=1 Tax=Nocardia higoensis TaxID=228599 RepID=UPI0002D6E80B|nr:hypothetical protein [Nocardia higoensis]
MHSPRSWKFWLQPLAGLAVALALIAAGTALFSVGEPTEDVPPARISEAPWTVPLSTPRWPGNGN